MPSDTRVVRQEAEASLQDDAIERWEMLYLHHFGYAANLRSVPIPQHVGGFNRLVIVAKGVSQNAVVVAGEGLFKTYLDQEDLDVCVTHNDRTAANGSYAVWVRDCIEADERWKKKSADDLVRLKVPGVTLLERLLMGLEHFDRTGLHLDMANWTLCSGSRYKDGEVPVVLWNHTGLLDVGSQCSASNVPFLRTREVKF